MGGWSEQRLEPRVDYRAPVKVIPAGQSRQVVIGQSLNLSPRGMLLDAPQPYPVGTEIICDIALPSGTKALQGRIVRVQPLSPSSTGLAIDFVDLSPADLSALRHLVHGEPDDPDALAVRVSGSTWLFRGRAQLDADGYHVSVPLPFLRADSPIELASSPSAPVITRALVRGISLQPAGADGVPRLRISVRLAGSGATDLDAGGDVDAPTAVDPAEEFDDHPQTPPPQILLTEDTRPDETEVTGQRRAAEEAAAARRARRLLTLVAALLLGVAAGLAVKYAPELRSRRWTSPAAASMTAPASSAATTGMPIGSPPPAAWAATPPALSPPAPEIVPVPPDPGGEKPQFRLTAERAQATVAVRGSMAGERHYALTSPPGLVVNLPDARPVPPFGRYRSASNAVREVWINPLPGGGTHLRFLYRGLAAREPAVELSPGFVTVALPASAVGDIGGAAR
jgi:PilZ domain